MIGGTGGNCGDELLLVVPGGFDGGGAIDPIDGGGVDGGVIIGGVLSDGFANIGGRLGGGLGLSARFGDCGTVGAFDLDCTTCSAFSASDVVSPQNSAGL